MKKHKFTVLFWVTNLNESLVSPATGGSCRLKNYSGYYIVIQYVALVVQMVVSHVWLRPSVVSTQITHPIWAQTPFIKVTLYTTFKGVRLYECSEVAHIFLAILILSSRPAVKWLGKPAADLGPTSGSAQKLVDRR